MDIGMILLLLIGVGLIVAGGMIRRRSLAAREGPAARGPSPIQEAQGVPPEVRLNPAGVRGATDPKGPAPREEG